MLSAFIPRLILPSLREGHLLETWVVGEVHKHLGWASGFVRLGHFRTGDGVEVDLVIERDDGAVVGFEVKASTTVGTRDGAGLDGLDLTVLTPENL